MLCAEGELLDTGDVVDTVGTEGSELDVEIVPEKVIEPEKLVLGVVKFDEFDGVVVVVAETFVGYA